MDREKKYFLRRTASWLALRSLFSATKNLPLPWGYSLGNVLGRLGFLLFPDRAKIALKNLKIAFPQASPRDRRKIAVSSFVSIGQNGFEVVHFLRNPGRLADIEISGRENLDAALKARKGVIGLTAHYGNFFLISLKLAAEGYATHVMMRPLKEMRSNEFLHRLRNGANIRTIYSLPHPEAVRNTIKALRDNGIVIVEADQNYKEAAVWVKLFGKLAATSTGSVVLAQRTGASIVPMYIKRTGMGRHRLVILPAEGLEVGENKELTVLRNVIKLTRIIEGWIREDPAQWAWIHRRWKPPLPGQLQPEKHNVEV